MMATISTTMGMSTAPTVGTSNYSDYAGPYDLHQMLSYRKAHGSPGEKQYLIDFIIPLRPYIVSDTKEKPEPMAFFVYIGKSNIMFTSHTDSVHQNVPEVHQVVHFKNGLYCKEDNQPLGADDTAGNWLMINMINAGVPGVYAFFRGEERGGIGSTYCAKHYPELFDNIKCAIAFDRKGTQSIITHQSGARGCSDEFARSLSTVLEMGHQIDTTGIYTDTAELFHLVPNCTNLSVGYLREHSKDETLNKSYIEALSNQLIRADWSKLDFTPPRVQVPTSIGKSGSPSSIFNEVLDLGSVSRSMRPLDIADYLWDNCIILPHPLRDKALKLAQQIYKSFE